jgi:hypothetical protein
VGWPAGSTGNCLEAQGQAQGHKSCYQLIFSFFPMKKRIAMQILNRRFYNEVLKEASYFVCTNLARFLTMIDGWKGMWTGEY